MQERHEALLEGRQPRFCEKAWVNRVDVGRREPHLGDQPVIARHDVESGVARPYHAADAEEAKVQRAAIDGRDDVAAGGEVAHLAPAFLDRAEATAHVALLLRVLR
jgi:hypothetical protein